MSKLLLVTDAWEPQTNGVVTTFKHMIAQLSQQGLEVEVLHPARFLTIPCPGYSEIRLALNTWKTAHMIRASQADYIHIATEGPLGLAARRYLNKLGWRYTTSLHTRFPEYVNERLPFIPVKLGYQFLKWFHKNSQTILATTRSMCAELEEYGFDRLKIWGRGVDIALFKPAERRQTNREDPVLLYVGRVAIEKNIETFLKLKVRGKKFIVGDGPLKNNLAKRYPDAEFIGYKYGEALAAYYAQADVFVFPSLTDTFGLVMLEAMACGTPVAAFPVTGPKDVVQEGVSGALHTDLATAITRALQLERSACRRYAEQHSWAACAARLQETLVRTQTSLETKIVNSPSYETKH